MRGGGTDLFFFFFFFANIYQKSFILIWSSNTHNQVCVLHSKYDTLDLLKNKNLIFENKNQILGVAKILFLERNFEKTFLKKKIKHNLRIQNGFGVKVLGIP